MLTDGELVVGIEIYTSVEDEEICRTNAPRNFGILCSGARFTTSTGRIVPVGDATGLETQPFGSAAAPTWTPT